MKNSRPPTHRRKRDTNHKEIRDGLKRGGHDVMDCGGIGNGVWDLLVDKVWMEIKTWEEYLFIFNYLNTIFVLSF